MGKTNPPTFDADPVAAEALALRWQRGELRPMLIDRTGDIRDAGNWDPETPAKAAADLTHCARVLIPPNLQADVLADPEVLDGWRCDFRRETWRFPFTTDHLQYWINMHVARHPGNGLMLRCGTSAFDLAVLAHAAWRRRPEMLAWLTMDALLTRDPAPVHFDLAAATLADDELAGDDNARRTLAGRLADELHKAAEACGMTGEAPEWGSAPPERDGMLALDAAAADFLAEYGKHGREAADNYREKAAKRWRHYSQNTGGPDALVNLYRAWWPDISAERFTARVDEVPSRFARNLCWVLWRDTVKPVLERLRRLPAPAAPIWLADALVIAPSATEIRNNPDGSLVIIADEVSRTLPVAVQAVARGALCAGGRRAVASVAAYLAIRAWHQYRAGERPDAVPMPAGRNELSKILGAKLSEDDLDAALDWLAGFKVAGYPCVAGVTSETVRRPGPGRPAKWRVVQVGFPLAPMGLERIFRQAGTVLPADLRWYSPVLSPAWAPLVGNHSTRERQRAAFALGLGAALMERREEYADRGLRIEDLRKPLRQMGLYVRSHASLLDAVLDAWQRDPAQPSLPLPGAPRRAVLVETAPGSGRWRLGPDYSDADRVIRLAAGRSEAGRRRRDRQRDRRRGRTSKT